MNSIYPILITLATAALLTGLFISYARQGKSGRKAKQKTPEEWMINRAALKSKKEPNNGPVCDMCSQPLDLSQGYFATTEQVITKPAYWEVVFSGQWAYVHNMDPQGAIIGKLVEQQAKISSTWGLCESCCQKLPIDQAQARAYAVAHTIPIPGAGPADTSRAAAAASAAWRKLYGSFPESIKFE
jgi:hypothetical protein